ncbi:MFS general substrate transporter [Decorospora gaudefroyi]|uniref:MFS general substrate transporter n=1 Tax=Decorospora gaudefroyi TaxID=184978 RepID=A0A6A5KHS5_9PLEO|nr:MFS general substrate transporter [Decorospora gaudefroyi]
MAVSPFAASFRSTGEPRSPVSSRTSSDCEGDKRQRTSTEERDLIAEIIADLSEYCEAAFSPSNSERRMRAASYESDDFRASLNHIRPHSRGSRGMSLNTTLEMDDLGNNARGRVRGFEDEEEDCVPELADSYHTSKRSSLSRSRPNSVRWQTDLKDSAVSLPDKHKGTKTHFPEAQSPKEELEIPSDGDQQEETHAVPIYPSKAKTAVIMVSLYISIFLVALDRTIIGPAIPAITNEFNSIGDIGWYGSAYMLTAAGFILLYGRVYTFFPTKPVFLSGIFLFEAGSVVCGAAQTSTTLIIGRAVAGLGSSGIFTGAILIMLNTVPLAKRPMLQSLFGACFGVASVAGPLLGGAFTGMSAAGWRWCFYINLPLGGLTVVVVCFLLKVEEQKPKLSTWKETVKHLDPLGTTLFLPSITCLLLALEWGAADHPWSSPRLIALLVVFAVLLVAFVTWQYFTRNTTATVPARIVLQRSVAFGGASQFCVGATMLTVSIYIPLWFQAIKGVSAMQSGINTIPLVLSVVVGSIMSGGLVQRIGYYTPFMIMGSCFMATGTGLVTTWNMGTSSSKWIGYQVLVGFGVGCTMQHPNIAVQTVLPRHDVPIGTAVLSLCQTLGGAVFAAVGQNLYIDKFTASLERINGIDPERILRSGATELTTGVPPTVRLQILKAYNNSLTQGTFFAALIIACLALPAALGMEWRSVKGNQAPQQKPAKQDVEKQEQQGKKPAPASILKNPTGGVSQSSLSVVSLSPPAPAHMNIFRSSGQFSSYLIAKANPDLRDELDARK